MISPCRSAVRLSAGAQLRGRQELCRGLVRGPRVIQADQLSMRVREQDDRVSVVNDCVGDPHQTPVVDANQMVGHPQSQSPTTRSDDT